MSDNSTISFGEVQSVMKNELDEVVRKAAQNMITIVSPFQSVGVRILISAINLTFILCIR
ncbi:MAG TPA: hypothetical protein QF753_15730 [Victivallales bacterium]|nr:hypothetical protein [Victivallales bacterium]